MTFNPTVKKLILESRDHNLSDAIRIGYEEGMQDFTKSLHEQRRTQDEAQRHQRFATRYYLMRLMLCRKQHATTIAAALAILLVPFADNLYAQTGGDDGPGGYLSWGKLLVITLVFLIWVRTSDWINRDAMNAG